MLFVPVGSASAHATLRSSEPAAGAQVPREPARVVLRFDEPVDVALGRVTVLGPNGAELATGYSSSDAGATITVAVRPGAGDGTYAVSYRVLSADTHPVSGGFLFRVGASGPNAIAPAAPGAPPAESASAPEDPIVRAVYAACRYAGFLGLLLVVGAVVFLVRLWPAGVPERGVTRLAWIGYGLLVAGSMGELVLQAPYAAGVSLTSITSRAFGEIVDTRYGTAHLVRFGLLAVLAPVLVGVAEARRARVCGTGGLRWPVFCAAPIGLALLVTWAGTGHGSSTDPAISVPSDVVHLAAMAVWLGGLVVLAAALLPSAGAVELRATLPGWSRLAMGCVAALVISGVVQAVVEVGSWPGLVDTSYGRLLLAKIGLLAVVLAVADSSRRWVHRHYAAPGARGLRGSTDVGERAGLPTRSEIRALRRAVSVESVFGVAAVAVAALLIQAAPSRTAAAPAPQATGTGQAPISRQGAYVARIPRDGMVIHLKVDPAVVGEQYIYLSATRPGGALVHVRQWTLTVSNLRLGLQDVNVPLIRDNGVGHHFVYGSFTMPVGGSWAIRVIARTSDVDETVVTRTVRLRP
ncbi:MAG TPA: copper resistance protein CopC [Jatrophihabitans sp.]|nr:copper resistance protein CopC [Jatrophihabitans sp.]